jgi:hypothetical protein
VLYCIEPWVVAARDEEHIPVARNHVLAGADRLVRGRRLGQPQNHVIASTHRRYLSH